MDNRFKPMTKAAAKELRLKSAKYEQSRAIADQQRDMRKDSESRVRKSTHTLIPVQL